MAAGLGIQFAHAQEGKEEGVGYGGSRIQLHPLMIPARGKDGKVVFEVLTLRVVLDVGEKERPGCFAIPIVHEHFLRYLYKANLTHADLIGARIQVLEKTLLDEAIKVTDKGYYSAVEVVTATTPPLTDPKSLTMSNQCR